MVWMVVILVMLWIGSIPVGAAEVVLIYSGNTQSFLEVCGCTENQLGGVGRRATALRMLRQTHPGALVVDAGGLFAGDSALDQWRCAVHVQAMREMGYDAANVGAGELRFGRGFFETQRDTGGVVFLSANMRSDGQLVPAFQSFERNGLRIGVIGVTGLVVESKHKTMGHTGVDLRRVLDEAGVMLQDPVLAVQEALSRVQADFWVVLSDLEAEANGALAEVLAGRGVVVSSRSQKVQTNWGGTPVLGTLPQGKAVGKAVLTVVDGRVTGQEVTQVYLKEEIGEDRDVGKLVEGFYKQVASDPVLQATARPRFAGFKMEQTIRGNKNGYAGAEACKNCHEAAYEDWKGTHHAGAFNRLLQVQKHYQPDCVTCHTTGFGYATGFQIGKDRETLTGVQCETCHGPGAHHVRRPEKGNIRGQVSGEVCQSCHDANQTPDFDARFASMLAEINHQGGHQAPSLETALESTPSGERVRVALFVMAHCPYGVQAEMALAPTLKAFGDRIDFQLYFIADEVGAENETQSTQRRSARQGPACEATTTEGSGRFRSLHGDAEIEEGIRQMVMMRQFPNRYYDYILCRNREGEQGDWEACASRVGIDAEEVKKWVANGEGERLFAENIRRANLLGIHASPTLLVNGREVEAFFDPVALAREICQKDASLPACASLPDCTGDSDCSKPGYVGVCLNPNTEHAACRFQAPVSFPVTVLNDADCAVCDTYHFIQSTLAFFPGAHVQTVDIQSKAGQALATQFEVDRVPTFILGAKFDKTARFFRFAQVVKQVGEAFVPDARMTPVARLLDRTPEPGRIDLFVGTASQYAIASTEDLIVWLASVGALDRLNLHFLGQSRGMLADEDVWHVCAQEVGPSRFLDYLLCRIQGIKNKQTGLSIEACAQQMGMDIHSLRQCASGNQGKALLTNSQEVARSMGVLLDMNPTVVIDNQVVVGGPMMQQVKVIFYRLHPELEQRDSAYRVQKSGEEP
ncbi:MAG: multiheme c-type cytochrome [bacterium]|nr:multiheme c-type cytochrome [bacterium]